MEQEREEEKNQTEITSGTNYGRTKQATSNARTPAHAHVCTSKHKYDTHQVVSHDSIQTTKQ